jgi:hypothetical protein
MIGCRKIVDGPASEKQLAETCGGVENHELAAGGM